MCIFPPPCSIAQVQATSPLEPLETRMLLCQVTGYSRVQLITQSEQALSDQQLAQLNQLATQRLAGEPMAYLLGYREFFGLQFKVTPDVLIPRPDTELLVELALERTASGKQLLDLGTGSGAIAISIAAQDKKIEVSAADISAAALDIARFNATQLLDANTKIQFHLSDWYSAIPTQKFHTIVSNPPYIVKDDIHLSQGDLRFEPIDALTDHSDGLTAYRKIIDGAPAHLHSNGWLLMEHGYDQSEAVQGLLKTAGFVEVQSWPDLAGILRVSGGRLGA